NLYRVCDGRKHSAGRCCDANNIIKRISEPGTPAVLQRERNLIGPETDFTTHWETRTVRLSQITGMDLAIMYWGSPWMAHPIVSFRFADALPLCFSIETRKSAGQQYSALRGLYRQYTLIYVVADERDSIRVRSNYRTGEGVYLYRTLASSAEARARFLEYIQTINTLRDNPRWYNDVTSNSTTITRTQRTCHQRAPCDSAVIVNW